MAKTGIVKHPIYLEHKTEIFHPENPARLQAIYSMLEEQDFEGALVPIEPRYAKLEELLLVHDPYYVDRVLDSAEKTRVRFDPDTEADPEAVLLTLAIRGQATCELRIPRDRYDPFLLLDLIERHGATVH